MIVSDPVKDKGGPILLQSQLIFFDLVGTPQGLVYSESRLAS